MAETAIDFPYLSSHFSLSETALSSLVEAPTAGLINQLLQSITTKAHEYDELKSDKLRLEVELENAVRSNESKIKVLKGTVEKGHTEVEDLRKKLHEAETTCSTLEAEISTLKSSSTSNEGEVSSLKSRISSLEESNRDTLRLLESKSSAHDKLAEELSSQHKKTIELRRELSTAEQNLQNANSASASARFREQSLQQELDLTKKNNEWFETELKTKNADHIKFRKEKNARISELQRENEETNSTIDALRRSENSLKSRLDETEQRYEESLSSIQQLKEEAIQAAESFRNELDSANRLAELQGSAAQNAKQRAQECQLSLEKATADAAEEISRLRIEIESEHNDKEAAERRVAELELNISQLESEGARNRSMSPARSINGMAPSTPMRPGTPGSTFTPRASRTKGGLTLTQMYTEYDKMRSLLAAEQRASQELRSTLDEMVQELESSKPEIDELRADHSRLEHAVMEMSQLLESSGKERDEATKEARRWQGQVEGLAREGDILRQQLRDLSSQVKVLVLEVAVSKQGEDYDREELEKIARQEIEESSVDLNSTGRFISQHLTTFKDLHDLQEQNVTLRRMLRELGDKMEGEEAQVKSATRQKEAEELKDLRVRVQTYRDEVANLLAQSKSYVKERDTFRSMLMHRRQNIGDNSVLSQSMPLGAVPPAISESQAKDSTDYADLLRKVQAHFDTFREETATDHKALRQQVNEISRKNSELLSEVSRSNSQLAAASQRAELLQSNFNMLKTENSDLSKRYSTLFENANRQDLRTQQAAEDLVEAKGLVDSLQRENANLKAEKDLWKNIEKRLIEDAENLRNERSRLDSLNANLQTILNEREHADSDTRRRLQSSVETLESELQATKRKLNDEMEESKKASMRREYDHEQSQKRIDDLVTSLSSVREELVAIKTTRDHLQSRVDELTVELKSAEERLSVIQSRPSVSAAPAEAPDATQESADGSGLTREQELAIEVSELKRDLDLAKNELAHAKEQAEEYRSISQSTEERMEAEAETNALYREETDRLIEEKDKKIQDLETRIEEISQELSTTSTEISKLRDEQGEATRHLEDQKATLESEITRLKDDNERQIAAAQFHQEDLKAQAEIAQHAQQNYETELVKHAEAAKNLQTVRADANQLKLEMVELRTQSETYKKDLSQKEESWAEQRARYESEMSELHKRREEVLHQNSVLHTQLENISTQISSLQRDRTTAAEDDDNSEDQSAPNLEGLQEVIKFLRREKEIVEVQYHLSTQEGKRLRQQFEYTQSQLDETRLKLEQQRRAAADTEHNALNHNKLMETLEELNLFRESSVTLRNQVKSTETALAEKTALLSELREKIEPLETKIYELEGNLEAKDGEIQLLQKDREQYQQRIQNILQKYDRVDPAEMEALKEKLASLETERDEATAARDEIQTQKAAIEVQIQNHEADIASRLSEQRNKLSEQFKARSRDLSGRVNAKATELAVAVQEKEALEEQLSKTKSELESCKASLANSSTAAAAAAGAAADTAAGLPEPSAPTTIPEATSETAPVNPTPASQFPTATTSVAVPGDEKKIKELEEKIQRLEAALVKKDGLLSAQDADLQAKIKERVDKVKEIGNAKLAEIRAAHQQEISKLSSTGDQTAAPDAPAVPDASAAPASPGAATTAPATPSKTWVMPDLTDTQARELVAKNPTIRTIVRNNILAQVAKEKANVQAQAQAQGSPNVNQEALAAMETKFNEEREALKKAHDAELGEKVKSAVELNDKKYAARLSMGETRFKSAQAKVEVVQKAAQDTPQKPVVEVWEVAKSARPAPAAPKPLAAASPAPASPAPATAQVTPPTASPAPTPVQPNNQTAAPLAQAPVQAPTPAPAPAPVPAPATEEQVQAVAQESDAQPTQQPTQQNDQQGKQPASLPTKPPANTPPGMLRALQSGLPIARGARGGRGGAQNQSGHAQQQNDQQQAQGQAQPQTQRGGGAQRGRGRGRGQNAGPQNQGQGGAATRGALNIQARQFIPTGNKRSREEGSDATANDATGGKRMRGGGGQARGGGSS
ncbi:nuclear pore complex protein An-Mlp1 [Penicillium angulare]|uniref:nuclear pore complex protein An-Mlp1 n=1 Tax=Penicillium angulare TaxID=116970 RepID=UPI0025401F5B|nr:nuclear pore complex protein An-Mlp1 [Penicillium angulare]KAJ5259533.1 nuclear pore complex protein An-Mlp1 [Penicillium angulare]